MKALLILALYNLRLPTFSCPSSLLARFFLWSCFLWRRLLGCGFCSRLRWSFRRRSFLRRRRWCWSSFLLSRRCSMFRRSSRRCGSVRSQRRRTSCGRSFASQCVLRLASTLLRRLISGRGFFLCSSPRGGGGGGGGSGGEYGSRNFTISVCERNLPSSSIRNASSSIFLYSGCSGVIRISAISGKGSFCRTSGHLVKKFLIFCSTAEARGVMALNKQRVWTVRHQEFPCL